MTYKTFRDIDQTAWDECVRYGAEVINDRLLAAYNKFYLAFNVLTEEAQKSVLDVLVSTWGRSEVLTSYYVQHVPVWVALENLFNRVFFKLPDAPKTRRACLYVLQHFTWHHGHHNLYNLMYPPVASGNGSTEATQPTTTQEETNMNALTANIKIETRTFITAPGIAYVDASKLDADAIIAAIAEAEKAIKELGTIENKPKVLQEKIDALQDGVRKLVEMLDARAA